MKIGIDLGGSHIGIGLVDENYQIVDKIEKDWTKEEQEILWTILPDQITMLVDDILKRNHLSEIESIGIGVPKSNIQKGMVYINGNRKIDLISSLELTFHTKVYIRNDVKCSGLCEKRIGNLKNYENALFLTLGTGIGGAYFYKNELMVPSTYPGLEVGSMIIVKDGKRCKCGRNGCFEAYSAMKIFREKVQEVFHISKVTSDIVFELLEKEENKKAMNKIIDEYLDYLALGLQNLIRIFEPDVICIGGSFVYYAPIFMERLEEKVKGYFINRSIPEILTAKYENDAGMIGAAMLESN